MRVYLGTGKGAATPDSAHILWGPQISLSGKIGSEATQGHRRLHVVTGCHTGSHEVTGSHMESQVFHQNTGNPGLHTQSYVAHEVSRGP